MYVEREFAPGVTGKAGLFLMPFGLLNQNHEPTAYHGVTRNFVNTAIIPTTWREVGPGAVGQHGVRPGLERRVDDRLQPHHVGTDVARGPGRPSTRDAWRRAVRCGA